jgi:hypothetical protein
MHVTSQRVAISLPVARSRAVALGFGSSVLICGGLVAGTTSASILRIALPGGPVAAAGQLAIAVHDAAGATVGGLGYVIGGGAVTAGVQVQTVASSGLAAVAGALPRARADLAAVAIGGRVIVVGGGTPTQPASAVLATTDGRTFTTIGTLRVAVRYPAVATLQGSVYIFGGVEPGGEVSLVQALDLATGSVRVVGRFPHPLWRATAFAIAGRVLVAGGRTGDQPESVIWSFDPTTGQVLAVGHLPYAVSDAAGVVVDGIGYLIGGEGASGELASIVAITVG